MEDEEKTLDEIRGLLEPVPMSEIIAKLPPEVRASITGPGNLGDVIATLAPEASFPLFGSILKPRRPGPSSQVDSGGPRLNESAARVATVESAGASNLIVQDSQRTAQDAIAQERQAALLTYKAECKAAGVNITDEMIARAGSPKWSNRTPVARWKANHPKCTAADDAKIRVVLNAKPHLPRK